MKSNETIQRNIDSEITTEVQVSRVFESLKIKICTCSVAVLALNRSDKPLSHKVWAGSFSINY